jgi:putative FmdB family regulatory protein
MPIYDFKCTKCDVVFEALVGVQEAPPCPNCKDSEHIERQVSMIGGYAIHGSNSGSTRPRQSGSFRVKK